MYKESDAFLFLGLINQYSREYMTIGLHGIIQIDDLVSEGLWVQMELHLIMRKGDTGSKRENAKIGDRSPGRKILLLKGLYRG